VRGIPLNKPEGVIKQDEKKNPLEGKEPVKPVTFWVMQRFPGDPEKHQGKNHEKQTLGKGERYRFHIYLSIVKSCNTKGLEPVFICSWLMIRKNQSPITNY